MSRLLSDGLIGFMWPKWLRSGEPSEFRVHSVEPFRLSVRRVTANVIRRFLEYE